MASEDEGASTEPRPVGRPTKYKAEYAQGIVAFCAEGYSLTAYAGSIGVGRSSITEWAKEHEEFSLAVNRAKAACALWWEKQGRKVGENGGSGGQSTMVIFHLKNHARDDFQDQNRVELTGKDGGPIETRGYTVAPEVAKSMDEWKQSVALPPDEEETGGRGEE